MTKTDKPIRILQVLTIMNRGGAECMIMNYYNNINRNKVQFDFLVHREERGAFDDEIEDLGGKIHRMPAVSPNNYFDYTKKLNAFFKKHEEYQIVHSHLNALSSIVLGIAKKNNVPIRIAHSHIAIESNIFKNIFKKNTDIKATIKDTIQSLVKYRVAKEATHFFACSIKAGEWLYGNNPSSNVVVINNAIDASIFSYNVNKAVEIKKEHNLAGKKVIGHVGRFNEQKNHFFLLNIFKKIIKKDPNCVLVLVGIGNLMDSIKKEAERFDIKDKVLFLGMRDDINDILQGFDLFLFPSLYEGLPVTLIEAQASGLAIVASNTITPEVDLTGLITFLSIKDSESKWADTVLDKLNYNRKINFEQIKSGRYDIHENAKSLQQFYITTTTDVRN